MRRGAVAAAELLAERRLALDFVEHVGAGVVVAADLGEVDDMALVEEGRARGVLLVTEDELAINVL